MCKSVGGIALLLLFLIGTTAKAEAVQCSGGWFSISAEVIRISPPAAVIKKLSDTKSDEVHENDVLCEGDTLIVPKDVVVELYETGRITTHTSDYKITGGSGALMGKAAEYLKIAFNLVTPNSPPSRPTSTSVRGTQEIANADVAAIIAISPLRDLPQQMITSSLQPLVGWRDGTADFKCEALDAHAEVLWSAEGIKSGWCEYSKLPDKTARLRVRDARRRSIGWNVAIVEWREIPRPDWITPTADTTLPAQEMSAWAIWLWQKGDAQWRMQALAMLNAASQTQWLASYFVDHVLAESPPIAPTEQEVR